MPANPPCRQRGQSLAEFVLCLPVLVLMIFGLLQLAALGIVLAFSHYAVSCALRSYTVFYAQGHSVATQKAGQAMEAAMAWCLPLPDMDLVISSESPKEGALAKVRYNGKGPLLFNAKFTAHVPLFFRLAGIRSLDLHVQGSILSEKTIETD
jgi:hypothetical protein